MINVALTNEWLERDPFRAYKLKFTRFERRYLTETELKVIEGKYFKIDRLQTVKDLIIFSFYTGLANDDTVSLTHQNNVEGIDQNAWLLTQRIKTSTPIKIPLLPKGISIIENYRNNPKCISEGCACYQI